MKRKIAILCIIGLVCVLASGCGTDNLSLVKENLSEKTEVYFFGESEGCYGTISCGQREGNYVIDGKSEGKTDFSLISISFSGETFGSALSATVTIDQTSEQVTLEFNSLNGCYMFDLEQKLSGGEQISIEISNKTIEFENLSKNFAISADKALEIATKELSNHIEAAKSLSGFSAECYLRVLDKRANNFEDVFWCFTLTNTNSESFSVVISTTDGSILAKSE
jgi:hypothetical protein